MATSFRPPAAGTRVVYAPTIDSRFPVNEALLDAARAIGPLVREHADEAERGRRLPRVVIDAMRHAGLFRMFTPRALGGFEADPITVARVAEEVAAFDPAAGWALQAGNTGAWWGSYMSPEGIAEIFADGPDLMMAASFSPPHRAEEVADGWRLTGRGPLASTIQDSPWVMMSGIVFDGEQPRMTPHGPEIVALVMHTSEVEVIDTWHSLGMRGTDSGDVAAHGVFVPRARGFRLSPEHARAPEFQGPLYALPAPVSVYAVVAPVALAIARSAIGELRELSVRKTPMGSMKTLRDRPAVQSAVALAEAKLRAARLFFYDAFACAWQRALDGEGFSLEQRADLMLAAAHAVRTASRVTELMHRMGGTSGIYARNRLERLFRDAQTVRHHGFLCEARYETVGQVHLGVQPEFPMVVF